MAGCLPCALFMGRQRRGKESKLTRGDKMIEQERKFIPRILKGCMDCMVPAPNPWNSALKTSTIKVEVLCGTIWHLFFPKHVTAAVQLKQTCAMKTTSQPWNWTCIFQQTFGTYQYQICKIALQLLQYSDVFSIQHTSIHMYPQSMLGLSFEIHGGAHLCTSQWPDISRLIWHRKNLLEHVAASQNVKPRSIPWTHRPIHTPDPYQNAGDPDRSIRLNHSAWNA
jgi:hypothetical protein